MVRAKTEFLVEKRDGRTQGLRLTKLARSIGLALRGQPSESRAVEIASTVLAGLRRTRAARPLTTVEVAQAVQRALLGLGQREAARRYEQARCAREQRRRTLGGIRPARLDERRAPAVGAPVSRM